MKRFPFMVRLNTTQALHNKAGCLFPLLCLLVSGCAYDRDFINDYNTAVPAMRDYAIEHLPDLTQDERQVIATAEPMIGHANYVDVHFKWTNVCEVLSGAPPKCEPYRVVDLRPNRSEGNSLLGESSGTDR